MSAEFINYNFIIV